MLALLKILIKRIQVVGLLICVLILNACSDREKNSSLIFEELNESLERSNKIFEGQIKSSILGIESLTKNPVTFEIGERILKRAETVNSSYSQTIFFVDSLIKLLKSKNYTEEKEIVKKVFQKDNNANILYEKLFKPGREVFKVDEIIKKEFENYEPISNVKFRNSFKDFKKFEQIFSSIKVYQKQ